MHRDAHIVDHVDDVFDLFGIDDVVRQVIIDFGIGQEALFLAARNELLELASCYCLLLHVSRSRRNALHVKNANDQLYWFDSI
jgi:hypothetical protein